MLLILKKIISFFNCVLNIIISILFYAILGYNISLTFDYISIYAASIVTSVFFVFIYLDLLLRFTKFSWYYKIISIVPLIICINFILNPQLLYILLYRWLAITVYLFYSIFELYPIYYATAILNCIACSNYISFFVFFIAFQLISVIKLLAIALTLLLLSAILYLIIRLISGIQEDFPILKIIIFLLRVIILVFIYIASILIFYLTPSILLVFFIIILFTIFILKLADSIKLN